MHTVPWGSPPPPKVHRAGFWAFWKLREYLVCLAPQAGLERGGELGWAGCFLWGPWGSARQYRLMGRVG